MCLLTSALWFQVAVDRRRHGFDLYSAGSGHSIPAEWRGEGSDGSQGGLTKTHMGGWGNLPAQGCQVTCGRGGMIGKGRGEGGHGDVVAILELDRGIRDSSWCPPRIREEEKLMSLYLKLFQNKSQRGPGINKGFNWLLGVDKGSPWVLK